MHGHLHFVFACRTGTVRMRVLVFVARAIEVNRPYLGR
jgi:hypothetical protein